MIFGQTVSNKDSIDSYSSKITIKIVKSWQKISFNTKLLNCQFDPCCSNYCIQAIENRGFFKGSMLAADRISRCHPFAKKYYKVNQKGRLINPITDKTFKVNRNLFTYSSFGASFFIPGIHKSTNGRVYDGISTFLLVSLSSFKAFRLYKNKNYFYIPYLMISTTFYISDIFVNFKSFK